MLVDGHSLAFRCYFSYRKPHKQGLRTQTGIPTSVSYGFLKSLYLQADALKPDAVVIAWDAWKENKLYRQHLYPEYKSNRNLGGVRAPDFEVDVAGLRKLLSEGLCLPNLSASGHEGDDVIGTLTAIAKGNNFAVRIISGDRDVFQLVDDCKDVAAMFLGTRMHSDKTIPLIRSDGVVDVFGVQPQKVPDYKGLAGDSVDNIPGVRGIGHVTAGKLLLEYETIDGVYASLDALRPRVRKLLEDGRESAYISKELATIKCDVPLEFVKSETRQLGSIDTRRLETLLQELEFKSFISHHMEDLVDVFTNRCGTDSWLSDICREI